jgi:hypothetical protein
LSPRENEPQPTQTRAPNPERAFRIETSFSVSILRVAIAACVVILVLLTLAVHAGFNAMLRPVVTLLGVAAAFTSLLSRGHIRISSRRTANQHYDIQDLSDDVRAMLPEGAKRVTT